MLSPALPTAKQSRKASFDSVDKRLQENEANMLNMETYIESKRVQLTELQHYLIQEFAEMQEQREKEGRMVEVFRGEVRGLLADVK
jgi:hypothetical protein